MQVFVFRMETITECDKFKELSACACEESLNERRQLRYLVHPALHIAAPSIRLGIEKSNS